MPNSGRSASPASARPTAKRGRGWRSRTLGWMARRFGPETVLPIINSMERTGSATYDAQPEAVLAGLPAAERSHARIMQAMAEPSRKAGSAAAISRGSRDGIAPARGNSLRAAVLGANDGLVSNLSLVTGVIGADLSAHSVLMTGIAGLLAGACSMGMGEWLSVNSAREFYQAQIATEADELAEFPEEEKQELMLIYQAKGLPEQQAKALADRIIGNPDTALRDAGARGTRYRPRGTRRLGVERRRHVFPLVRGRGRCAGDPVVLRRRAARRDLQSRC